MVSRLVNESFVPSAQQTSVLYCRLSDFWSMRYVRSTRINIDASNFYLPKLSIVWTLSLKSNLLWNWNMVKGLERMLLYYRKRGRACKKVLDCAKQNKSKLLSCLSAVCHWFCLGFFHPLFWIRKPKDDSAMRLRTFLPHVYLHLIFDIL